jgi:tetratricopeptide (TPR) repeat protein
LGGSALVYSTYIYLLHVPYFYHAHQLFLQIAVEQGLPGLVTFVGMLMTALYGLLATHAWRGSAILRLLYSAVLGSLLALIVYGLQDAEIYVQPTLPILFVPFGFALALQWRMIRTIGATPIPPLKWDGWLPVGVPGLMLLGVMVWPGAGAIQANLGAVAQTKAELSVYQWPQWRVQDELRYQHAVDLEPALRHYRSALAVNPQHATAYRRLGQITLAVGDIGTAEEYLSQTLLLNPQDRAARQLLGEVYAISGRVDQAVASWRAIKLSPEQLAVRAWWYSYVDVPPRAKLFSAAVQRFKSEQPTSE